MRVVGAARCDVGVDEPCARLPNGDAVMALKIHRLLVALLSIIANVIIMAVIAMLGMEALAAPAFSRSGRGSGYAYVGPTLMNIVAFIGVFFGYYAFRILTALRGLIWHELLKKLGIRR
jgi:hypothetical protein